MSSLIIDASAAVHFLRSDPAALARFARHHDTVLVPSIFDYEVANATLRMARRDVVTPPTADRMLAALLHLPVTRVPAHGRLLQVALGLTARLTLAGAIYLALAQDTDGNLLTMDTALADVARSTGTVVVEV